jgi:hypothetical protein
MKMFGFRKRKPLSETLEQALANHINAILDVALAMRRNPTDATRRQEFLDHVWSDPYTLGWLMGDALGFLANSLTGRNTIDDADTLERATRAIADAFALVSGQRTIMQRVAAVTSNQYFQRGSRTGTASYWCAVVENAFGDCSVLPDWLAENEDVQRSLRKVGTTGVYEYMLRSSFAEVITKDDQQRAQEWMKDFVPLSD